MRYISPIFSSIILLLHFSCSSQTHSNALINSSSPYLLQHAHNPVNWYPWGEEALEKAKNEDKLLIISIGYAACHWCHVMEHESFEDSTVAEAMNSSFVSIKVDREERPDIDQIYMNAAYIINQRGGWPLNAIALPDGRPIFAGTYFPKDEWMKVLEHFSKLHREKPELLTQAAGQITQGLNQIEAILPNPNPPAFAQDSVDMMFESVIEQMDMNKGGLNKAPKFPMPVIHEFLLNYHHQSGNEDAFEAVISTLDNMMNGGIYDHVGGGFARYSTDAIWKVPHFEKMLYDNAQLMTLYSHAFQLTKDPRYQRVVEESMGWLEREMLDDSGGFYSSLDADSEGEEGKYYVWSEAELNSLLGDQTEVFKEYYSVKPNGNWEGHNILWLSDDPEKIAEKYQLTEAELQSSLKASRDILLETRQKRIPPGLDDKILTSWNALMIKGLVTAYRVFGEDSYLNRALATSNFIRREMMQEDGRLLRNYKDGKTSINAFADDYSFTIEAFVAMYEATFDEEWLFAADTLMQYVMEHFSHESSGMFYYTSDLDKALITRSKEVPDNVIPASNSSLANGLFLLGTYLYKDEYVSRAEKMLNTAWPNAREGGAYYANWGILLNRIVHPPYEVAIMGDNWQRIRKELDQHYLPNVLLLGGESEGKLELLANKLMSGENWIYVCQQKVCQRPVQEVGDALGQMR